MPLFNQDKAMADCDDDELRARGLTDAGIAKIRASADHPMGLGPDLGCGDFELPPPSTIEQRVTYLEQLVSQLYYRMLKSEKLDG